MKRKWLLGVLLVLLGCSLFMNFIHFANTHKGNSADAVMESGYYYDGGYEKEAYSYAPSAADNAVYAEESPADEMLIKHASITVVCDKNADVFEEVRNKIKEFQGRIASSDSYRYSGEQNAYSIVARIPADQYDSFLNYLKGTGEVTGFSENATDIYKQYQDNALRIEMYETKLERLYALMEQAKDVNDLIALEDSVSQTIYNIESLRSVQGDYEDEVAYSTINITLQPKVVQTIEERCFGDVLREAVTDSINSLLNVLEFLLRGFIFLFPYLIVAGLGFFLFRKFRKNKQA